MYTLILLFSSGGGLIAGTYNTLESCDYSGRAAMNAKLEYICLPRDAAPKPAAARPKQIVPMPRPAPAPKTQP